jgi:hypothetical protein
MDDPSGRVEAAWAHQVDDSTMRWQEAGCVVAFYGGDEGVATVGNVLEVLQLEEGKVRHMPIGRKMVRGTSLTVGE